MVRHSFVIILIIIIILYVVVVVVRIYIYNKTKIRFTRNEQSKDSLCIYSRVHKGAKIKDVGCCEWSMDIT